MDPINLNMNQMTISIYFLGLDPLDLSVGYEDNFCLAIFLFLFYFLHNLTIFFNSTRLIWTCNNFFFFFVGGQSCIFILYPLIMGWSLPFSKAIVMRLNKYSNLQNPKFMHDLIVHKPLTVRPWLMNCLIISKRV